jgi:tight adherence protein C
MFEAFLMGLMVIVGITGCVFFAHQFRSVVDVRVERRLMRLPDTGKDIPGKGQNSLRAGASGGLKSGLASLAARITPRDKDQISALRTRLVRAGIYSPSAPALYCCAKVVLMLLCPLAGLAVEALRLAPPYYGILAGAILGGISMLAPGIWLRRRTLHRQAVLRKSLPDFLDLLVACLESGASFQGALQRVTDELRVAHPMLGAEMSQVQREIELGAPPASAMRHFGERSGQEGVRALGTMIEQTQRFGTSLAVALRTHADMLRVRREQRAEEQANRVAVKILIPTLLFIFPAIFVVMAGPAAIQIYEKLTQPRAAALPGQQPQ